nr:YraN family protein [Ornithinimicrobium murale]
MGMSHQVASAIGAYGEGLACEYLTGLGYEVVERNWRCDQGELDIVARDGACLVFCEVKTRRSTAFGTPVEAVTRAKAGRLRRLAIRWLREHDQRSDEVRIDVIGVLRPPGAPAQLEHLIGVA